MPLVSQIASINLILWEIQSVYNTLHSHQQCMRVLITHMTASTWCHTLKQNPFTFLMDILWYLTTVCLHLPTD
jgi:hypothetical protein